MSSARVPVDVDGRRLALSNLDKVLYPAAGTTKAELVDYYTRMAPTILPHLRGRPITLVRCPDGPAGECFYEKNCPGHRPEWVHTARIQTRGRGSRRERTSIDFCLVEDRPTLVWLANLAAIELHPYLHRAATPGCPTLVVFDLDPGPPAGTIDAARVALTIRDALGRFGLRTLVKTSGSKGIQVYLPLNTPTSYDETTAFANTLARALERQEPERIVSNMKKELRRGKVLVDWSQNNAHKTTVGAYSVRAREQPTVSTPVTWDELNDAVAREDADALRFPMGDVLERVATHGDLFAAAEELEQELPSDRPSMDA